MFLNTQVDIDNLPGIEEIRLKSISKKYLKIIIINRISLFLVLFVVLLIMTWFMDDKTPQNLLLYGFVILTVFLILNLTIGLLAFKKRKYAIRDHDVVYAKGLIINSLTTVPISRIQHIEENRSWLARQFGLATLKIFTAGESGSDLSIHGLPKDDAKKIHDYISTKVNGSI
ncbi:hypothetical protein SAMN04515667_1937 [Formosa sp. Hel1_31_208]|uniref:PH domain-containing protein n=1 Tax=Formosa sp. Hel1_31_208 TaxID=1798225 RepID=UPI00087A8A2B|nr:PH domain-containing protein [Formosa sp. Hel1_31_208]SDS33280.1 hypothetical protein SAMN04515667_1937 [Formosa sp. Hel1_31_208]